LAKFAEMGGPAFASILAVLLGLSFQRLTQVFDGAEY
jgi:hypothetical protein